MIFEILALALGIVGISFLITAPFNNILVRYRANYKPRRLHLSEEGDLTPPTGLNVSSFLGLFKRVYQVEGFLGFYKGIWPTFLGGVALTTGLTFFMQPNLRIIENPYTSPNIGVFRTGLYATLVTLILPPTVILTNRAITTSEKLSFFNPARALRVLLTERERRNPLVLYRTPGLVISQILHNSIVIGLGYARRFLIGPYWFSRSLKLEGLLPVSLFFLAVVAGVAILTPLEVMIVRLSIQRNHSEDDFNAPEELPEYAGLEEDVIELREDEEPYLGLFDCAKKMIDEEGWRSLYRAWWLTLLVPTVG